MESDSVRTLGDTTLVDLWIDGKFRAITISRQAIESYLQVPAAAAAAMTEDDRREFVRTHLSLVVGAASARLRADPDLEKIEIEAGQLGGETPRPHPGERRQGGDRRKGDRRKQNLGPPGGVERRS
jgi:hypothetical protein